MKTDCTSISQSNTTPANDTVLCYDIDIACSKVVHVNPLKADESSGLSLAPGAVLNYTGHTNTSCSNNNVTYYMTTVTKHSDMSAAYPGDQITYTITFTNHTPVSLKSIHIFDKLPAGVTLVPDSIVPAPAPGETLATGISTPPVAAGGCVTLSYRVIADCSTKGCLINQAQAIYYFYDESGCQSYGHSRSNQCHVTIIPDSKCSRKRLVCTCRNSYNNLYIRDFSYFVKCQLTQLETQYYETAAGYSAKISFTIAVSYIDCNGQKKLLIHNGHTLFTNLPPHLCKKQTNVRVSDLCCRNNQFRRVMVKFKVEFS